MEWMEPGYVSDQKKDEHMDYLDTAMYTGLHKHNG